MNLLLPLTQLHHDSGLQWLILHDERARECTNFGDSRDGDAGNLVAAVNDHAPLNLGLTDWRLPSIEDLETLIGREDPTNGVFWSSSVCEENDKAFWCLRFPDGLVDAEWPWIKHSVRLVRNLP